MANFTRSLHEGTNYGCKMLSGIFKVFKDFDVAMFQILHFKRLFNPGWFLDVSITQYVDKNIS